MYPTQDPTQGGVPKPPLGPFFGTDEAVNLSLLFDPAAPVAHAAQEHGPHRRGGGHGASATDMKTPLRFLGRLRPLRSGGSF